jgi:hypothetical protein
MNRLFGYVKEYWLQFSRRLFIVSLLILSLLIFVNYHFRLNDFLLSAPSFWGRFFNFTGLYLPIFAGAYALNFVIQKRAFPRKRFFYVLLFIAPLIFAAKVALRPSDIFTLDKYFLITMQWPLKAILVLSAVYLMGLVGRYPLPLFGLSVRGTEIKPYLVLLISMIPLLLLAGTGTDFQQVYPKLKMVDRAAGDWFWALVFELSYGLDFFTIELFFRGFLIIAFIKFVSKDAILPMAVFYCSIHFGKPLMECISSYFGGLILGAIVFNTRSIWGGLIVHLGIAWMMEVVGVLL